MSFWKKPTILILLLCCCFTIPSCRPVDVHFLAPATQYNTTWSSSYGDVEIIFNVEEEERLRFSGRAKMDDGRYVDMYPRYVNEYGVICIGETEIPVLVWEPMYSMEIVSDELPNSPEGEDDWYSCLEKYTLLVCSVDYKTKKHCVATVVESNLDEIPVGTVLDFYQIDAR